MALKWIGAILIILSCSSCGFLIAAGKRKEEGLLYQLIDVLHFMEAELQYRLTPLPELCRMAAGETKGILRNVFLNLHRELTWQKQPDAGSCMYTSIHRTGEIPSRVRRLLVMGAVLWAAMICPDNCRASRQCGNDAAKAWKVSAKTETNV